MGLVASLLKKYDVIPIFGIVPITSSTLLINNTFLSSYQVCVCVCVREGERIEIGRGRQERQGGRREKTAQSQSTNIMCH